MITITLFSSLSDSGRTEMPVAAETTLGSLFNFLYASEAMEDFLVKVNGSEVDSGYELSNGDKVTITPRKNEGA